MFLNVLNRLLIKMDLEGMGISLVLWFESEMSPSIRHLHILFLLGAVAWENWTDDPCRRQHSLGGFETASLGYFHFSISASFLHPNVEAINVLLLMPCLLRTAKLPCHDILLCIWDYLPK